LKIKLIAVLISTVLVLTGSAGCKARTGDHGRFNNRNVPTAKATKPPTRAPETATSFVDYPACLRNTDTGGVFNPPCVLDLKDGSYLLEFEDGHGQYFKLCADKTAKNCVRKTGNRFVVVS
jgi:hypothetical protein